MNTGDYHSSATYCNSLQKPQERPLKAKSSGSIPDGATKPSKSLKIRPKTNIGAALCASLRKLIIQGRISPWKHALGVAGLGQWRCCGSGECVLARHSGFALRHTCPLP
jgi:hypothetical protein